MHMSVGHPLEPGLSISGHIPKEKNVFPSIPNSYSASIEASCVSLPPRLECWLTWSHAATHMLWFKCEMSPITHLNTFPQMVIPVGKVIAGSKSLGAGHEVFAAWPHFLFPFCFHIINVIRRACLLHLPQCLLRCGGLYALWKCEIPSLLSQQQKETKTEISTEKWGCCC